MKEVLIIDLNDGDETTTVTFLDQEVRIRRIGCHGDAERARATIAEYDGKVDAIGLDGYPAELELGNVRMMHTVGSTLPSAAQNTPLVDGGQLFWPIALSRAFSPRNAS